MQKTKIDIHFDHRNLEDSKALIAYAYPKLAHVCEHGHAYKVTLVCSIQDDQYHHINAVVHMPLNHVEAIALQTRDMYQTVDTIMPKIERVIRKHADRLRGNTHTESVCRKQSFGG